MRRDMDLARQILQQVEEKASGQGLVKLDIPEHSEEDVSYHVMLLKEAGLMLASDDSSMGHFKWDAQRLTWQGHEFLDAIKNDTVWNKVKETVKEKGGAIPFEFLKALALHIAKGIFNIG
jgi:Hypothetical protein (DUF2513)